MRFLMLLLFVSATACLSCPITEAAEKGRQTDVAVAAETRIDWVYALSNQSPAQPPADWLKDFRSTDQKYELYVPPQYNDSRSAPLVLFISPGDRSTGFA